MTHARSRNQGPVFLVPLTTIFIITYLDIDYVFAFSLMLVSEARRTMANVAKQAAYLSHRTRDVEEVSARVARGLSDLRGRIEMARHAADSVKGTMRLLQRF